MMKRLFAVSFVLAFALPGFTAEPAALVTNVIRAYENANLEIVIPADGSITNIPSDPPRVQFHSAKDDITLQITLKRDELVRVQRTPTAREMEAIVQKATEPQYAKGSVEKKVVLEKLKGPEVSGTFARFTDARWVDKAPPAGEYRNVASGMFRCGQFWGYFTLLTQDKDGPSFRQGLTTMESLRPKP